MRKRISILLLAALMLSICGTAFAADASAAGLPFGDSYRWGDYYMNEYLDFAVDTSGWTLDYDSTWENTSLEAELQTYGNALLLQGYNSEVFFSAGAVLVGDYGYTYSEAEICDMYKSTFKDYLTNNGYRVTRTEAYTVQMGLQEHAAFKMKLRSMDNISCTGLVVTQLLGDYMAYYVIVTEREATTFAMLYSITGVRSAALVDLQIYRGKWKTVCDMVDMYVPKSWKEFRAYEDAASGVYLCLGAKDESEFLVLDYFDGSGYTLEQAAVSLVEGCAYGPVIINGIYGLLLERVDADGSLYSGFIFNDSVGGICGIFYSAWQYNEVTAATRDNLMHSICVVGQGGF